MTGQDQRSDLVRPYRLIFSPRIDWLTMSLAKPYLLTVAKRIWLAKDISTKTDWLKFPYETTWLVENPAWKNLIDWNTSMLKTDLQNSGASTVDPPTRPCPFDLWPSSETMFFWPLTLLWDHVFFIFDLRQTHTHTDRQTHFSFFHMTLPSVEGILIGQKTDLKKVRLAENPAWKKFDW